MAKIKTKYGTIINVSGLTPEQIAKVRQMAEGNGAYGSKGAALADSLRKRNSASGTTQTTQTTLPPETNAATNQFANTGITTASDSVDPTALFNSAYNSWNDDRAKAIRDEAQNAAYSFTSRNFADQKQQEMAALEQDMAERGIPFDPNNAESLYGKNKAAIDSKYQDLDFQAKNLAVSQGNQAYQTETGVKQTAIDSFINSALGMSQADLAKYGIDQNTMLQIKNLKAQKEIARMGRSGGGGGGGTDTTSDIISSSNF